MATYDGEDLAAVASIVVSLFSAALLTVMVFRAEPRMLGSRRGWVLVAVGITLLALRVFGHFLDGPGFQLARRFAGIAAAVLVPLGLLLALRASQDARGAAS